MDNPIKILDFDRAKGVNFDTFFMLCLARWAANFGVNKGWGIMKGLLGFTGTAISGCVDYANQLYYGSLAAVNSALEKSTEKDDPVVLKTIKQRAENLEALMKRGAEVRSELSLGRTKYF